MKNKLLIISLIVTNFIFFSSSMFPWGDKGHKLISKKSVDFLPADMQSFKAWGNYLEVHAPDPDNRKRDDKTEGPKHFIDIDFYKEFISGNMIQDETKLISEYGKDTVIRQGVLPWATLETFNHLTQAFKDKNKELALRYAADLGHYVADGHQPMHTVLNYNGQLTGQKGLHFRYEITMVDDHLKDLEDSYQPHPAPYIQNPENFIFSYISGANSINGIILDADNFAFKLANERNGDQYFNLLWHRTKYITEIQFNKASEDLASLIYTAWVNGGKPNYDDMK